MGTRYYSLDSLSTFLEQALGRYEHLHEDQQVPHADESGGPPDTVDGLDKAWKKAETVFEQGQEVHGIVAGWNRGGLLVRWDRLQGFVPTSQLKEIPLFDDDSARDSKLARWVGEELSLRVIELDRSRNRLVFSERATVWGPNEGEQLLSDVSPGEVRRGLVSNLCDFGAFVDLGGIDGLIHISELSWGRVTHPREVLRIGEEVEVYVISVDRDNRRIALSLKRLKPNPWATVDERYAPGQVTRATITNVVDFGAFAQIEEGLEGLVHISEMADGQVASASQVVSMGDEVSVRILRIDSSNHRLALSIRQAGGESPGPDEAFDAESPADSVAWDESPTFLF